MAFYNWVNFTDLFNFGIRIDPSFRNNQTSLWHMRDRLFLSMFERIAGAYAYAVSISKRKIIEYVFLACAIIPLFVLVYVHVSFIQTPVNCLNHVTRHWPHDGILRIELGFRQPYLYAYGKCHHNLFESMYQENNFKVILRTEYAKVINKTIVQPSSGLEDGAKLQEIIKENPVYSFSSFAASEYVTTIKEEIACVEDYSDLDDLQEYIIEYTLEYGFLKLSSTARQKLKVPILVVVIDPQDKKCFGNRFSQFLLRYVVGYSDVLMSSLKQLVDGDETKGFVRNVITGDQYRFVNKSLTWTSYGIAAITMIAFTLSISMLLRYSHHQIFMFIIQLLNILEFNLNVSFPAASLLTVVFALVGMEAIMSEFFNDNTTAFYIILIVWIGDQFDSICSHNIVTKRHWLRFFFLYHFGFYAYDHRFNGQYSTLALLTSWMFIQHSMVYFIHHYELPSTRVDHAEDIETENSNQVANSELHHNSNESVSILTNAIAHPAMPPEGERVPLHDVEPLPQNNDDPCDLNLN